MVRGWLSLFQFGQNLSGKLLAQLHTPLVEWINVPYHALDKHFMFIERNQGTQCSGVQFFE